MIPNGARGPAGHAAAVAAAAFLAVLLAMPRLHAQPPQAAATPPPKKPAVTFVELGSVKCVPCKMMQPVMESIAKKYGDQVSIVFYDVWTDSGRALGQPYKIRAIPTQVFLDGDGKEIFRHEGYFPESEIDKLLLKQGLKVVTPPPK